MYELDIPLTAHLTAERAGALVEAIVAAEGLQVRLRGTLARYPGSLHWHLASPAARGTLEVTYWPARNRLWLSVQAGRRAEWIPQAVPRLHAALDPAVEKVQGESE
jgi:hypothetical protein